MWKLSNFGQCVLPLAVWWCAAGVLAGCGADNPFSEPEVGGMGLVRPGAAGAARVDSPPAREFFPLTPGNHWTYDRRFEIVITEIDGSGGLTGISTRQVFEATVERTLTGVESLFGRDYVVEASVLTVDGDPDTVRSWLRYRQDHAGLYVADVAAGEPPVDDGMRAPADAAAWTGSMPAALSQAAPTGLARAVWRRHVHRIRIARRFLDTPFATGRPGGAKPEEIVRLDYPLHPGLVFSTRTEPFKVSSVVEAMDVLDLPAGRLNGFRIRIENELLDPEDEVTLWYGRCGRLGFLARLETLAMDIETGEVVRIVTTETEWLSTLALDEPGRYRSR